MVADIVTSSISRAPNSSLGLECRLMAPSVMREKTKKEKVIDVERFLMRFTSILTQDF